MNEKMDVQYAKTTVQINYPTCKSKWNETCRSHQSKKKLAHFFFDEGNKIKEMYRSSQVVDINNNKV